MFAYPLSPNACTYIWHKLCNIQMHTVSVLCSTFQTILWPLATKWTVFTKLWSLIWEIWGSNRHSNELTGHKTENWCWKVIWYFSETAKANMSNGPSSTIKFTRIDLCKWHDRNVKIKEEKAVSIARSLLVNMETFVGFCKCYFWCYANYLKTCSMVNWLHTNTFANLSTRAEEAKRVIYGEICSGSGSMRVWMHIFRPFL